VLAVLRRRLPAVLLVLLVALVPALAAQASDAGLRSIVRKHEAPLRKAQADVADSLVKVVRPNPSTTQAKRLKARVKTLRSRVATVARALRDEDGDGFATAEAQEQALRGLTQLRLGYTDIDKAVSRFAVPKKKLPKSAAGMRKLYKQIETEVNRGLKRITTGNADLKRAFDVILGRVVPTTPTAPTETTPAPAPDPVPVPVDPVPVPTETTPAPAPAG
jgi:hypothetical protein